MLKKRITPAGILTAAAVFFVAGYVIYPLLQLLKISFAGNGESVNWLGPNVLKAGKNSIILSLITVAGSGIVGLYFAYVLNYTRFRIRSLLATLILIPLAMPPMVGVIAFIFLLGDQGLFARLLHLKHFSFDGWPAIITIHIYSFYPLFFLFISTALKKMDSSLIEAAYTMGAGRLKTFYKVIFPQLIPAVTGASLLTFMASMASFSAPFIYGGSLRFLTTEIYYAKVNGDTSQSAAIALLLTVISVAFLLAFRWYRNKLPVAGAKKGTIKTNALFNDHRFDYIMIALVILLGLLVIMPLLALIILSVSAEDPLMQAGFGFHFSLIHYKAIFQSADLLLPLKNSLIASVIAIGITLFLAVIISHVIAGRKSFFKSVLELAASLPYGVPGTVIALCLILSFNVPNVFSFNTVLIGTFWIIPIAYAIRNLPVLTQSLLAGLHGIDRSLKEAASSLGAKPFRIWRSVTLPLLVPAIVQGCLLVFINSFGEFVATVLLYTYATKTISIALYAELRMYNNGIAAAQGTLLFLIIVLVIFFSRKIN